MSLSVSLVLAAVIAVVVVAERPSHGDHGGDGSEGPLDGPHWDVGYEGPLDGPHWDVGYEGPLDGPHWDVGYEGPLDSPHGDVGAHGSYQRGPSYETPHGPAKGHGVGYNGPAYGGPGYGHQEPGHGYQRSGYRYQRPGYAKSGFGYGRPAHYGEYAGHTEKKSLDVIDKMYHRLNTIQDELKTGSEILANLEARLSLDKKELDELTLISLPEMAEHDIGQNSGIGKLEDDLSHLESLLSTLEDQMDGLEEDNTMNVLAQEATGNLYAGQRRIDVEQDKEIAELLAAVNDFQHKMITVLENDFLAVDNNVDTLDDFVDTIKKSDDKKMCEVGQVTLDANDRKAEYLFQTRFDSVPQILHSLCGYNFDLEKRPDNHNDYYKEPNAIGVFVTADASKTGVTLEMFDQSFGDTSIISADVCFQACSIGPNVRVAPALLPV